MWLQWKRTLGSLHLVSSDFVTDASPHADLAVYSFSVINHRCEYDYMLSPVSLPHESPRSGDSDTHSYLTQEVTAGSLKLSLL